MFIHSENAWWGEEGGISLWYTQNKTLSPTEISGSIWGAQYSTQQGGAVTVHRSLLQIKMLWFSQRLTWYTVVFYYIVETCRECLCRQLGLPSFSLAVTWNIAESWGEKLSRRHFWRSSCPAFYSDLTEKTDRVVWGFTKFWKLQGWQSRKNSQ